MSIFTLKMIALCTMIIDHIGAYIPSTPEILRCVGRISAPLFLFCAIQGYKKTSNKYRYMCRLYVFSIFMGVIDSVLYVNANYIRVILLTIVIISIIDALKNKERFAKRNALIFGIWQIFWGVFWGHYFLTYYIDIPESILFILLPILGSPLFMEYGLLFVMLGLLIYYYGDSKRLLCGIYIVVTVVVFLFNNTSILQKAIYKSSEFFQVSNISSEMIWQVADLIFDGFFDTDVRFLENGLFSSIQWLMILALPLFLRYNGERGKNIKWIFYVAYPLNIVVLRILGAII